MLKTVLLKNLLRVFSVTNAHFIREFYNTTKNMICILMIYLSEEEFEEISWFETCAIKNTVKIDCYSL